MSPAMTRRSKIIIAIAGAFIALCAAFVIPNLVRALTTPASNACVNNLRQIDGAKQQWMLEERKTTNDTPSWEDIRPYLGRGNEGFLPKCPHGGTYTIGKVGEDPKCTYPGDTMK